MPNRFRAYELVQAVLKVLFVAGNAHAQLPRQLIMARGGARCLLGRGHVHGAAVVGHRVVQLVRICKNSGCFMSEDVSTLSALESKLARRQYLVNTKLSELHIN